VNAAVFDLSSLLLIGFVLGIYIEKGTASAECDGDRGCRDVVWHFDDCDNVIVSKCQPRLPDFTAQLFNWPPGLLLPDPAD
jgi:hypothetical protein